VAAVLGSALLAACGQVPRLRPVPPGDATRLGAQCDARFPRGAWQAVHAIEFWLPGGARSALLGVVTGTPRRDTLRLVALAPEGMTLLDATSRADGVRVRHAVPPFTNRPLVERMVRDVRLMLFRPTGSPSMGRLPGRGRACRWRQRGDTIDVLPESGGGWIIHRYDRRGRLDREVRCTGGVRAGFAARVVLKARGAMGYGLTLRLLRITPLDALRRPGR
jgi:hypothetical protein